MYQDTEVQHAVNTFQLGLPRVPAAGHAGELLGRSSGNSLEFQEFRPYIPGDDIRHLDWASYARTDSLMVRLYREEISPRTEVLVDTSLSMTTSEAKSQMTRQLGAMFALLSARLGGRPTVIPLGDGPAHSIGTEGLDILRRLPFTGRSTMVDLLGSNFVPLKRQAVRIVISDFLFPHDPGPLVRRLATDASMLWLVQVINRFESDPAEIGGRRFIDLERRLETEMIVDRAAIAGYRKRLTALQTEIMRACRSVHGMFATVIGESGLSNICQQDLCKVGMLRVA